MYKVLGTISFFKGVGVFSLCSLMEGDLERLMFLGDSDLIGSRGEGIVFIDIHCRSEVLLAVPLTLRLSVLSMIWHD